MSKGHSLQDPYLNTLRKERVPVSIYLVNGIKLQGQIESFDQFVILLKNTVSQMVYKHAISTVVPSRPVRLPSGDQRPSRATLDGSPLCSLSAQVVGNRLFWCIWKGRTPRRVKTRRSSRSWCVRPARKRWHSSASPATSRAPNILSAVARSRSCTTWSRPKTSSW